MKNLILLLSVFSVCINLAQAHGLGRSDLIDMTGAYGYILGQEKMVESIKEKYPNLVGNIALFEAQWSRRFPGAKQALLKHLKCFGLDEGKVRELVDNNNSYKQMLDQYKIKSEEEGISILQYYRTRLSSPEEYDRKVFSILNDVVYHDYPAQEFYVDNRNYSSKGHEKARGLDIRISVPFSWKQEEGVRPHIVQKWTKKDEEHVLTMMITVVDYPQVENEFSENNLRSYINDGSIWELFPYPNADIKDRSVMMTNMEGNPAIIMDSLFKYNRAGRDLAVSNSSLFFGICGKFVNVTFSAFGKDVSKVKDVSQKYQELKFLMFNSITIPQKYDF